MTHSVPASFIDELRRSVAGVTTDPGELARCARDWSWSSLYAAERGRASLPAAVVRATSDADVAATLRLATAAGVPVVPRGGGSGVMGAAVPYAGGIVVDVSAMDAIVDVDEVSLTATVEAGHNGRAFEEALNARGLSFPHFPASAEWASVGGYVAARGSGVLSSRYGKIEDLVLALRVVTPTGEVIDTLPVPRHAVGPELTQLFVGSEGTLGIVTRVTVKLIPLPAHRRFEALALPSLQAGVDGLRTVMQRGLRPAVIRFYDAEASAATLAPVVGAALESPTALLMFEGEAGVADAEADRALELLDAVGGTRAGPGPVQHVVGPPLRLLPPAPLPDAARDVGHDRRRRAVRPDPRRVRRDPRRARAVRRARAAPAHAPEPLVRLGRDGLPALHGRRTSRRSTTRLALYREIWAAGVEAILDAGGVINDHHGVGSTLAPYVARQWGPAYDTLLRVKRALDPANVMNPGKLGFPVDWPAQHVD